jgi:hypothetical protein
MVDPEIARVLGSCSDPESGCFAGDPEALGHMINTDNGVIRASYERIADAADEAGSKGTALADATYTPATLEVVGFFPSSQSRGGRSVICEIGSGKPERIGDLLEISASGLKARIARCAFACGQAAVGSCPVRTPRS